MTTVFVRPAILPPHLLQPAYLLLINDSTLSSTTVSQKLRIELNDARAFVEALVNQGVAKRARHGDGFTITKPASDFSLESGEPTETVVAHTPAPVVGTLAGRCDDQAASVAAMASDDKVPDREQAGPATSVAPLPTTEVSVPMSSTGPDCADAQYGAGELIKPQYLGLDLLVLDPGIQARAAMDEVAIGEYAELMRIGKEFTPPVAYFDGEQYFVADGFHRCKAAIKADLSEILVIVKTGSRRDAILYAAGANSNHGVRRTNADKARAVRMLLADPEWGRWSDSEIAKRCAVDHKTVAKYRGESDLGKSQVKSRRVKRSGKEIEMATGNIGGSRGRKAPTAAGRSSSEPAGPYQLQPGLSVGIEGLHAAIRNIGGLMQTSDSATMFKMRANLARELGTCAAALADLIQQLNSAAGNEQQALEPLAGIAA